MKARLFFWAFAGVVVLAAVVLLLPKSPFYLPELQANRPQYHGQSMRYWVKALDSDDTETRHKAIFALGSIGSDAVVAVPKLAAILLEDDDNVSRGQASLALSKMTPASVSAVDALTHALEDQFLVVRMNAAMALFRLKDKAKPATATLIRCIKDESNKTNLHFFAVTIQEQMMLALGTATAGSKEGVTALTESLEKASTVSMQRAAIRALGFVGSEAKPALPLVKPHVKSEVEELRDAAVEAVGKIELETKSGA